jgi:hypothetical protein
MATTTRVIDANVSGTVYTNDLNDALEALDTSHAGSSAPTDELSNGKLWLDTSATPATLKVYNNSVWEPIGGGILYEEKSTTHLAIAGEGVVANTSSGSWTLTLPASPVSGDVVVIVDGADFSVNNLTVARNGSTIAGLSEDLVLDIGNVSVHLVYAFSNWQVFAQVGAAGANSSIDDNGNATAITIDSSGNLLVGKTATGAGVVGTEIFSDGLMRLTRDAGSALILDREASDGDIMEFRKDGTTVGSIGTASGDIYVGTGDTNLFFDDGNDAIWPATTGGATRDAATDLGYSSIRFKDLYLSGGVYLGGTGAANKLEDYEEGTWTPAIGGTTTNPSVTYSYQNGYYTKVGQLVSVHFRIWATAISGGSGLARITNLPFTAATGGNSHVQVSSLSTMSGPSSYNGGFVEPLSDWIYLNQSGGQVFDVSTVGAGFFWASVTYRAT